MAQSDDQNEEITDGPDEPIPGSRRLFRFLGLILLLLAVLLAVYGTVAYIAWQRGQSLRVENAREALQEELDRQVGHASEDIDAGNFTLALRRLEWVLAQDTDYPGAGLLQQQAQAGRNARLTPSPAPNVTSTPAKEETPIAQSDPEEPFVSLEQLMAAEDWQEAVPAITAFQSQYPNYQRLETDRMLYDAYIGLGVSLVSGEQVELGLFYLGQAEKLGDLPTEVEDYRTWADLYLLGIGYSGIDWGSMIFYFRGLCAAAPFYQDSCATLRDALVNYGDQYTTALDWCPAQELYAEAIQLESETSLAEKLQEAAAFCLEATPTATGTITGTVPITGTPPVAPDEP